MIGFSLVACCKIGVTLNVLSFSDDDFIIPSASLSLCVRFCVCVSVFFFVFLSFFDLTQFFTFSSKTLLFNKLKGYQYYFNDLKGEKGLNLNLNLKFKFILILIRTL